MALCPLKKTKWSFNNLKKKKQVEKMFYHFKQANMKV